MFQILCKIFGHPVLPAGVFFLHGEVVVVRQVVTVVLYACVLPFVCRNVSVIICLRTSFFFYFSLVVVVKLEKMFGNHVVGRGNFLVFYPLIEFVPAVFIKRIDKGKTFPVESESLVYSKTL